MSSAPPPSDCHETVISGLNTVTGTAEPSFASSLSIVDGWDDGRTASWVHEQPTIDGSPGTDSLPPPSVVVSPFSDAPATNSPRVIPAPLPQPSPAYSDPGIKPQASNAENQLTSWFGRIIRPVCHLIESMTELGVYSRG
ncbi:uncharacterized protein AKAME5_000150300 [Lates japonicus]|uniref:Uncharacterized protein n=1 Tax=Lates japonicus TaxID=270547 RepID=A0AAD3M4V7_LATJO|nr:uncharacterized protein AKAME5_000150300 [Lates japonicus]